MQVNLTLYPETPAPTEYCVNIYGTCVANANTTSGMSPTLTLDPSGSWTHADECYCIEGHELQIIESTKQCQGRILNNITTSYLCISLPSFYL